MHKRLVFQTIGKILFLEALFMVFPLGIGIYYRESTRNLLSFAGVMALLSFFGLSNLKSRDENAYFNIKDGFGIVSLSWLGMSLFGSLPFVFSGEIPSLVDAFFETASGFTTTGASILPNVEALSHSMLFWRSFTHFIGGMGILVFALAVLPKYVRGSVNVMKAEVPGPSFGKLVSKIDITAKILYKIYICMTIGLIILLRAVGMNWFDSFIHAFGAAGTGGFSNRALSVGYYDSAAVDYILGIAMIAFGINFNLYYFTLIGKGREALRNEELKRYLGLVLIAVFLIVWNVRPLYESGFRLVRDVFFTVSSIVTTTGFAVTDFDRWPGFSKVLLVLLMMVGSCAGSTAGGLKVSRVSILVKSAIRDLKLSLNPQRVLRVVEDGHPVEEGVQKNALIYLIWYVLIYAACLILLSIWEGDFTTSFSSVAATLNNIGPGFSKVGPMGNFAFYNNFSKIVLSFAMIIGRLEIFPVLVLFMPGTWSKK